MAVHQRMSQYMRRHTGKIIAIMIPIVFQSAAHIVFEVHCNLWFTHFVEECKALSRSGLEKGVTDVGSTFL